MEEKEDVGVIPGVKDLHPSDAENLLEGGDSDPDGEGEKEAEEEQPNAIPAWAHVPTTVKLPRSGQSIAFMRFPAAWTTDPKGPDRWCCCWAITEADERLAYNRARGDMGRGATELAKATVKIVDGNKADWSGDRKKPGDVSEFWNAIGPKGRQMVRNYYVRTHIATEEEALDFFSNHFVNVTVA